MTEVKDGRYPFVSTQIPMEFAQLSRLEDGGTNAQEHKRIRTQCNFVPLRVYFAGAIPKPAQAGQDDRL